jgi:hypothetical protein
VAASERWAAGVRALQLLCVSLVLGGYGYGAEQDPLVEGFKRLAAHGQAGSWEQARAPLAALAPSAQEIAAALGADPQPALQSAVEQRDRAALARALTALGYLAIRLKLASSTREGLSDYYAAKYRVEAARSYYMELLAPAVLRQLRGRALHERIWEGFDAARAALGRPGFLGRGTEPPDLPRFERASEQVAAALREAFPFVSEVDR